MLLSPLENLNKTDIHNQSIIVLSAYCLTAKLPKSGSFLKSGSSLQSHSALQTYTIDRILPTSTTHDEIMNFRGSDLQQTPAFAHYPGMEDSSVSFLTPTTFLSTTPFAPVHPVATNKHVVSTSHTSTAHFYANHAGCSNLFWSSPRCAPGQPTWRFFSSRRTCIPFSDLQQHVVFTVWPLPILCHGTKHSACWSLFWTCRICS
jgi:hypothetical protein